jgi:6,7-dimethyl-8-ribityllumazine synthase
MVQGHIDGVGRFLGLEAVPGGQDYWMHVEFPPSLERYLVFKGSIAIEGISLTIAKLSGNRLSVAIIPHTCDVTNLKSLTPLDAVNIETDIAGKYLDKWTNRTAELSEDTAIQNPESARFGVVVSRFNSLITDRLLEGALDAFKRERVSKDQIEVLRVPGAYEIPVAAKLLANTKRFDAIVCVGCLVRGETLHYELIANEVARGIGQSALDTGIPHAFGVVACDTTNQALDRAGLKAGNKGFEATITAIEMARIRSQIAE